MKDNILRIALIGPESTGKSSLCRSLAEHFNTCWVTEIARDYISDLKRPYTKQDVLACAELQFRAEQQLLKKANTVLFCDTEFIVFRVWLLDVFNATSNWIEEKIEDEKNHFFLLTTPDIDFVKDPVRENGHRREFFFDWYKKELDARKYKYEIVSGKGELRFLNALSAVTNAIARAS